MKSCPFCAEDIQDAAIVCKHCGRDLFKAAQASSVQTQVIVQQTNQPSAGVAAVLSLIIPGAGQLYRGRVLSGILWFIFVVAGYAMLIVPGLILHLICVVAAASGPTRASDVVISNAVVAAGVASNATTAPQAIPAVESSNTIAKAVGRGFAILLHPLDTIRSGRAGAQAFLVIAYLLIALYVAGVISAGTRTAAKPTLARPATAARVNQPLAEPDELCSVEAPPSAQAGARNWCEGGIFTLVHVSNDANNFVVLLQFSKKGYVTYQNSKYAVLNRFRGITDEMVEKTDMNVAFSLHNPTGQMVGGCARRRGARESTCN